MAEQKQSSAIVTSKTKAVTIHKYLDRPDVVAEIQKAFPEAASAQRLIRLSITQIQTTPGLAECDPISLLACVIESAQLNLEPDPVLGEIYFVPFKKRASIIVGWKGFVKLATNGPDIYKVVPTIVRKGEKFALRYGTNPAIDHIPGEHGAENNADTAWRGVYAVAFHRDGHTDFEYLEREDVFARRSKSSAWRNDKKDSPWFTDKAAMWRKSAIRALGARLPKSPKLQRALEIDRRTDEGRTDLVIPTEHGFELAAIPETVGGDSEPIKPSEAIDDTKTAKTAKTKPATKGKKQDIPRSATADLVPKANLPKVSDAVIDVKPSPSKPPANANPGKEVGGKEDPIITAKELTDLYNFAANVGSWNADTIQAEVKKKFGVYPSKLTRSKIPAVKLMLEGA